MLRIVNDWTTTNWKAGGLFLSIALHLDVFPFLFRGQHSATKANLSSRLLGRVDPASNNTVDFKVEKKRAIYSVERGNFRFKYFLAILLLDYVCSCDLPSGSIIFCNFRSDYDYRLVLLQKAARAVSDCAIAAVLSVGRYMSGRFWVRFQSVDATL